MVYITGWVNAHFLFICIVLYGLLVCFVLFNLDAPQAVKQILLLIKLLSKNLKNEFETGLSEYDSVALKI